MKKIIKNIKNGSILKKAFCYLLILLGFSNSKLQALEIRNKNYNYLKRKYKKNIKTIKRQDKSTDKINYIWICWFQGEKKAPDLVKKCIESVRKNIPSGDIVIITLENMNKYVELPDYISDKVEKGIISLTHLSDILRVELMKKYGGLWLDATVLMTGPLPKYVYDSDFFMYRHSIPDDLTITFNSWLIYSQPNNPIFIEMSKLLKAYWKKERKLKDYFLFHLFLTLIYEENEEAFEGVMYVPDELPEVLSRIIFKKYDNNKFKELIKMTNVHKLSTKFDMELFKSNCYYDVLINGRVKKDE